MKIGVAVETGGWVGLVNKIFQQHNADFEQAITAQHLAFAVSLYYNASLFHHPFAACALIHFSSER